MNEAKPTMRYTDGLRFREHVHVVDRENILENACQPPEIIKQNVDCGQPTHHFNAPLTRRRGRFPGKRGPPR